MQYRSPFSILYLTGNFPDSWDDAGLLRVQKQLLLELEHHGGGTLSIGEEVWTKDDILKLIDALRSPEERVFHQWIADNPALCLLLERGQVPLDGPVYNPLLADHPAFASFQTFVSPYLVESVSRGMHQAFVQYEFARVQRLLDVAMALAPKPAEELLARLVQWLENLAQTLERVDAGEEAFDREQLQYITPDFIALLNALPERHAPLRKWLSVGLTNVLAKNSPGTKFSRIGYKCLLELHCAPAVRRVVLSNYRRFTWARHVFTLGKILAMVLALGLMLHGLINLALPAPPRRQTVQVVPAVYDTYQSYRNYLRAIVQKQLTPAGADSMRYILLTDPQVNNNHTLWHHAVPGTHLSNYKPAVAQTLTIVNGSHYDAVLFVMGDSALYNGFLSQGDSLQTFIHVRDKLAFYAGNNWASPGGMKRGVYPWTDVKAQYGIFTQVDSTTLLLLGKTYHLPAGTGKKPLRVSLTTGTSGLQLVPNTVLVEEISQKSP
jgi:hypothetical protein